METPEQAPLAGSQEALLPSARVRGGSNSRAFKVAGLTTLGCLLLASQVFTVYLVVNQKQAIHTMQQDSETLRKQLTRSSQRGSVQNVAEMAEMKVKGEINWAVKLRHREIQTPPMKMYMPMPSLPLLKGFQTEAETAKTSVKKREDTVATVGLETQVERLLQDSVLPRFNASTFFDNLQSLKEQMEESEWKGLESWIRHWLIFQKAQEKPPAPPTEKPALPLQSKCQMEASMSARRLGFFQPQCDESGHYRSVQCWHSTGFCWCVDDNGTAIEGTYSRNRPHCQRGRLSKAALPQLMSLGAITDDGN